MPIFAQHKVEPLVKAHRGNSRFELLPFAGPGRQRVRDFARFLEPSGAFWPRVRDFARFLGPSGGQAQRRAACKGHRRQGFEILCVFCKELQLSKCFLDPSGAFWLMVRFPVFLFFQTLRRFLGT